MIIIKYLSKKIKETCKNLDKKTKKLIKNGLKYCFLLSIISTFILITYLLFIHSVSIYQIGILIFELSLYLSADCIVAGIAVDTIKKQIS